MGMEKTLGRAVHFVMPDGSCRAAIVVGYSDRGSNLLIFMDGPSDGPSAVATEPGTGEQVRVSSDRLGDLLAYAGSVPHEMPATGPKLNVPFSWHWPESN